MKIIVQRKGLKFKKEFISYSLFNAWLLRHEGEWIKVIFEFTAPSTVDRANKNIAFTTDHPHVTTLV